jgi:peroxiredoxin
MITGELAPRIGDPGPDFRDLSDTGGDRYSLSSFAGDPILVLVFMANGCPTVKGYGERLQQLQSDYEGKGVRLIGINSNNSALSPPDTLEAMEQRSREAGHNFPYLKDPDGRVARSYGATRTPHVFVLDTSRRLRYRGRIDDSRLPHTVTTRDLQKALDDLVAERPVRVPETEPFGCSIIW